MSDVSTRIALSYAVAVVLPLVVLAAVFRAGQHLEAPMHAGGSWDLATGPVCGADSFRVSQTGRRLSITFAGQAVPGMIEGDRVQFSAAHPSCDVMVMATLDRRLNPPVIVGEMRRDACEACPPVPFRAVRSAAARVSR